MKSLFSSFCLVASLLVSATPALAAVELETRAYREVIVTDASGKQSKKLETLERAAPGQEVVYVITYRNTGSEPATGLVVNNQVPEAVTFVAGSAEGANAKAEVSVNGQVFGQLASLRVANADGSERAAEAADITAVRWTIEGTVARGSTGNVRYRAVLK